MSETPKTMVRCGDANPNGNISMTLRCGCMRELPMEHAYRCTGCAGWFHRVCIFNHFEAEEGHSVAHRALRQISDLVLSDGRMPQEVEDKIEGLCKRGLSRVQYEISPLPPPR